MTRIAEIADRLHRLAKRREDEGIYTDAALCEEAAAYLTAALAAEPGEAVQGYCSDCECTGPITNGRCRCGSARIAPSAHHHPLPLKEEVERVLASARVVVDACAGDNKPAIGWAREVRGEMDILLSRIRAKTQEGWRDIASAPKDASSILYINKFGEIGYCYWSEAGSPFDQSMWWDDLADDECCPVGWLPADTLPASPSPEAKGGRS